MTGKLLNRRPQLLVVVALVVAGIAGCAFLQRGSTNLAELRAFDSYRVYFAGHRVGGFPLTDVVKEAYGKNKGRRARWEFFYGDCTPPAGEGGCAPPIEIQNYSTCRRWANAYPGKPRLFNFRGAKAARMSSAGSFEVYTGRTTVVIFAHHRSSARAAARLLRTVDQRHPPKRLPPPVRGSLWGKLPCQDKPG